MSQLIFKKMSEVMKDVGSVGKDQKNTAQGFKFRGIDQFVNALYPALTKHGVFMSPRCVREEHEVREVIRSNGKTGCDKLVTILMEYDFFAEDGSKVTIGPIPAEGMDSGDKATNKALSAALKYALIQTFSIPTEDMAEPDRDSPENGLSVKTSSKESPSEESEAPTRGRRGRRPSTEGKRFDEVAKEVQETETTESESSQPEQSTEEIQQESQPSRTSFRRPRRG